MNYLLRNVRGVKPTRKNVWFIKVVYTIFFSSTRKKCSDKFFDKYDVELSVENLCKSLNVRKHFMLIIKKFTAYKLKYMKEIDF